MNEIKDAIEKGRSMTFIGKYSKNIVKNAMRINDN